MRSKIFAVVAVSFVSLTACMPAPRQTDVTKMTDKELQAVMNGSNRQDARLTVILGLGMALSAAGLGWTISAAQARNRKLAKRP